MWLHIFVRSQLRVACRGLAKIDKKVGVVTKHANGTRGGEGGEKASQNNNYCRYIFPRA